MTHEQSEEQIFEYPYADEGIAILNWCTAGGRNSPEQVRSYLLLADQTILEDAGTWKFEKITKADLVAQLKKFRADFAANPLITPPYDPKYPLNDRKIFVINGEPEPEYDSEDVIIPADQPRRAAL